ncbi:MAG TPA: cyclopropane-fatty-acyl-phospholipid synthase family protein [Acidimicrobiales bacterium]|nr:cyclopropane-fatty-acyl-phospholipid synthase family protein [Acidimicrobiales bacterium]
MTSPGTGATQAAIEHHYDVGADFYRLWLDPRMVYSCALWPDALDDDLAAAQLAKLDWHAASARADGAGRVLDVGCGWGAMLARLRGAHGVGHAVGLTLSSDQAALAAAGDDPGIEIRLEDWRDHRPTAPYDAIVSIGAFEHFARLDLDDAARTAVYRQWFDACRSWLAPGGRVSLQTIAYEDFDPATGSEAAFFSEEIFPESSLPCLRQIVTASEPGFRVLAVRSDADHYAHTLLLWQRRLEDAKQAAVDLVGRDTYRRYVRYLRLSRAMFERRVCTLYRITLERRPG